MTGIKMHVKYPKIYVLGNEENEGIFSFPNDMIYVQEKIDGANFQFQVLNGELITGTRNNLIVAGSDGCKFIAHGWIMKNVAPQDVNPDLIYYGESMQKHTISYVAAPPFVGFDIMSKQTGAFIRPEAAEKEFARLGILFIPTIYKKRVCEVRVDELREFVNNPQNRSKFDGTLEGVVLKNYERVNKFGRPLFTKIVGDLFKEQNKHVFNPLKTTSDREREIADTYVTRARIHKLVAIHEELNAKKIQMSDMPILWKVVASDILQEEILNIRKDYDTVNFKNFDREIAKRTATLLKQLLMERSVALGSGV